MSAGEASLLGPRQPRVGVRETRPLAPTVLSTETITGTPRSSAEVGLRASSTLPLLELAALSSVIQPIGAASPPVATAQRLALIGPAGVTAGGLTALRKQRSLTLVPASLLVGLIRIIALRLVRKPLKEMTPSVGPKPRLGPQGSTCMEMGAVVQRPLKG